MDTEHNANMRTEEVKREVENEIVSEAVQNDGYVRVEQGKTNDHIPVWLYK